MKTHFDGFGKRHSQTEDDRISDEFFGHGIFAVDGTTCSTGGVYESPV